MEEHTFSELRTWERCKMLHQHSFEAGKGFGLRPKAISIPLTVGHFVHDMLYRLRKGTYLSSYDVSTSGRSDDLVSWWLDENVPADQHSKKLELALWRALGALKAYPDKYPGETETEWVALEQEFRFEKDGNVIRGKIDAVYDESDNLVLQDNKYYSRRNGDLQFSLPMQFTIYGFGVHSLSERFPTFIEKNIILKPDIRLKKGESLEGYSERAVKKTDFLRERIMIDPALYQRGWELHVAPKLLSLPATLPYFEDGACFRYNETCPFLPLCEAKLKQVEPDADVKALYVEKSKKHEELK